MEAQLRAELADVERQFAAKTIEEHEALATLARAIDERRALWCRMQAIWRQLARLDHD